jgi:hypothetical protein
VAVDPLADRLIVRTTPALRRRCLDAVQSRPNPPGGMIAWRSLRPRSQIARNASAVALSCRLSGRLSNQAMNSTWASMRPATGSVNAKPGRDGRPAGGEGHRHGIAGGAMAGLAFGSGHGSLADRLAGHDCNSEALRHEVSPGG